MDQTPPSSDPTPPPQPPSAPPYAHGAPQQPPAAPPAAYPAPGGYGYAPPTNTLAIVSLISSLVGIFVIPLIGQIVGIVTGHMALSQIRQRGERGHGMALAGTIIGWVSIGLGVLATVAIIIFVVATAGSSAVVSGAVTGS